MYAYINIKIFVDISWRSGLTALHSACLFGHLLAREDVEHTGCSQWLLNYIMAEEQELEMGFILRRVKT